MIGTTISLCIDAPTWLLILCLRAHTVCAPLDVVQIACTDTLLECYLDDNKNFCDDNVMELYDGK